MTIRGAWVAEAIFAVGATIMAHGDDSGLVLPPNVAPVQVVVVPIFRGEDDRVAVANAVEGVETLVLPVALVQVQHDGGLGEEIRRAGEDPVLVLPGRDGGRHA